LREPYPSADTFKRVSKKRTPKKKEDYHVEDRARLLSYIVLTGLSPAINKRGEGKR
jgi:hypothetical protein